MNLVNTKTPYCAAALDGRNPWLGIPNFNYLLPQREPNSQELETCEHDLEVHRWWSQEDPNIEK